MRTVFEILPASMDPENCTLLCEVSNEGFSYSIKDENARSFSTLGIYHYDKTKPPVGLPIALQIVFHQKEVLSRKFKKVKIVYSLPQSVLIPFPMYNREWNATVMNIMHGDLHATETLLTDVVATRFVYNCYRIPTALHEVMKAQFPEATSMHQYSLLLREPAEGKEKLTVIFYTQKIIVTLVRDGKYQLVNSFQYRSPEDVSYTLLNICRQFDIRGIRLEISGLIEENSALYKEVYKFFADIELTSLPAGMQYAEEITKYPSHYFSNIFAIDSCE